MIIKWLMACFMIIAFVPTLALGAIVGVAWFLDRWLEFFWNVIMVHEK